MLYYFIAIGNADIEHANDHLRSCKHKLMTDQLLEHFTSANAIVANMY